MVKGKNRCNGLAEELWTKICGTDKDESNKKYPAMHKARKMSADTLNIDEGRKQKVPEVA